MRFLDIATVTHQSARHGKLAHRMNRRHRVLGCQDGQLLCTAIEYYVGGDDEPISLQLEQLGEASVEIALDADSQDVELQPTSAGRRLQAFQIGTGINWIGRINENRKTFGFWHQFVQQLQSFWGNGYVQ